MDLVLQTLFQVLAPTGVAAPAAWMFGLRPLRCERPPCRGAMIIMIKYCCLRLGRLRRRFGLRALRCEPFRAAVHEGFEHSL